MRPLLIAVLVATATPVTAGATPMCDGQVATIVGTSESDGGGGTEDADVIVLLAGSDESNGYEGDDAICGNRGSDDLLGWWGNDRLFGGRGSDRVLGWGGDDLLDGGRGEDVLGTRELPIGDQRGLDRYVGGAGNDHLYALDAEDDETVLGGAGHDHIEIKDLGPGPDIVRGGRGIDTCLVDISTDIVTGCERINPGKSRAT